MSRSLLMALGGLGAGLVLGLLLASGDRNARADRRQAGGLESSTGALHVDGAPRTPGKGEARRQLRKQVERIYREAAQEEIAPDLLALAIAELDESLDHALAQQAAWRALAHERRRRRYGEMRTGGPILLQARNATAALLPPEHDGVPERLDLDSPPDRSAREVHVEGGGAIPPGKVLVIEGAVVDARFGFARRRRGGRVNLSLGGASLVALKSLSANVRVALKGRAFIHPAHERRVGLDVGSGVASVEIAGRLVTRDEAARLRPEPFRWIAEESDGLLRSGQPITIQIVADHGGGNPRRASIDGGHNGRFDARAPQSIWSDTQLVGTFERSLFHVDGTGVIPPGKVFLLRRIEYRGRLSPKKGRRSDLVIRANGRKLVETNAEINPVPNGVWEGEVRVPAGHEETVSLTLSYFGIGEARFYGDLIDE